MNEGIGEKMRKQNGVAIPVLIIGIVIIIAIASIIVHYVEDMVEENRLQDLRTNMLLIQAETKKDLEEVCFQTAKLDSKKEEDLATINEIKNENLKGKLVQGSEIENSIPQEINIDENCYYLDENNLSEIGVKDLDSNEYGYFIVKYDFSNITVEVMNTKGYEGKYTLTQLIDE